MRGRSRDSLIVLAVELDDHVAGMDARPAWPGRLSSTPATSAPCAVAEAEALGDRVVDLLDAHAEPAAPRLAELLQLRR